MPNTLDCTLTFGCTCNTVSKTLCKLLFVQVNIIVIVSTCQCVFLQCIYFYSKDAKILQNLENADFRQLGNPVILQKHCFQKQFNFYELTQQFPFACTHVWDSTKLTNARYFKRITLNLVRFLASLLLE